MIHKKIGVWDGPANAACPSQMLNVLLERVNVFVTLEENRYEHQYDHNQGDDVHDKPASVDLSEGGHEFGDVLAFGGDDSFEVIRGEVESESHDYVHDARY